MLHGNRPRAKIKVNQVVKHALRTQWVCHFAVTKSKSQAKPIPWNHWNHQARAKTLWADGPRWLCSECGTGTNMLSKQTWVTWLKRFVSYQVWLCTPRTEANPFSTPTWIFYMHCGSMWGCPLGPPNCIRTWPHTNRLTIGVMYTHLIIYVHIYIYVYVLINISIYIYRYIFI